MQHNHNIPRASFSIPNVRQTTLYYPNSGQFQMGTPESYNQQSVPPSHYGRCSCPYLSRIQKNEMILDIMLRKSDRQQLAKTKVTKIDKMKAQQAMPNENQCQCLNIQCKRSECNKPTCSNVAAPSPAKEELTKLQNEPFKEQTEQGLPENHTVKKFQSKIPVYTKRYKAGHAGPNPYKEVAGGGGSNKQTVNAKSALNVTPAQNYQSKIAIGKRRIAGGNDDTKCRKEDIENFYDCKSNSRSSLIMSATKRDNAAAAATTNKCNTNRTREELQTEQQTLKYSLETTILDLYDGNFQTKPTAKREEVEACNFLLDLIKERINSISCNDSADKRTSIKQTRSCVCFRQFGTCDCTCKDKCQGPPAFLTYNAVAHHQNNNMNASETRREEVDNNEKELQEELSEIDAALTSKCCAETNMHVKQIIVAENRTEKENRVCEANERDIYVDLDDESSIIAETNSINVEEIAKTSEELIQETSYITNKTEVLTPASTRTSRWCLDDNQYSRGQIFGLLGVKNVYDVKESSEQQDVQEPETYESAEKKVEECSKEEQQGDQIQESETCDSEEKKAEDSSKDDSGQQEEQQEEEEESEENDEYLFKHGQKQKPFVIDENQRVAGERLGLLGTRYTDGERRSITIEKKPKKQEKIVENNSDNEENKDKETINNNEENTNIVEEDELLEPKNGDLYAFRSHRLQNMIDVDATQHARGQHLGIIAAKPDKAEIEEPSDASLMVVEQTNEEMKPENNEEIKSKKDQNTEEKLDSKETVMEPCALTTNKKQQCCSNYTFGIFPARIEVKVDQAALKCQNQFIQPKDQNLTKQVPINCATEETKDDKFLECSNCAPQKKPIELKNNRVSYTSTSDPNQENFCRIHRDQKENNIAEKQNDCKIAKTAITLKSNGHKSSIKRLPSGQTAESSSQDQNGSTSGKRLSGSEDIHNEMQQNCCKKTSASFSQELPAKKSSPEDTQLAFFKCLAEQIRGKRKRLHAECNNQIPIQLRTTTDQGHINSLRHNTDHRNIQSPCCSKMTTPWRTKDSNYCHIPTNTPKSEYFIESQQNTEALYDQEKNVRKSCCNPGTTPWITNGSMKIQSRVLNEPTGHEFSVQNSCCNRPTCPRLPKESFTHETVTDVRVSNESKEKTNMGNLCCNRGTCPWIPKQSFQSENGRVLNELTPHEFSVQNSCCNRPTCPRLAKESSIQHQPIIFTTESARVLNEPTEHEFSVQNSCCNRPTCPRLPKESSKQQTVTDVRVSNESKEKTNMGNLCCNRGTCPWIPKQSFQSENGRVLNELTPHEFSVQNSCCNRPTCPRLVKESSIQHQPTTCTTENVRVINEPTEHKLSVQHSCCNRPTCPRLAKESSIQHQPITCTTQNVRVLKEPTEHQLSVQNPCCHRPTCPRLAKESSIQHQPTTCTTENVRVLQEPTEHQLSVQNPCCNRPTCPRLAKESSIQHQPTTCTTQNVRVLKGPTEHQLSVQNPCCNRPTCPRLAKQSSIQHQPTTCTTQNVRVLKEPTEHQLNVQNPCCNRPTCPRLVKESSIQHQPTTCTTENVRVINEPTEHKLSVQNSCCKRPTCPRLPKETLKCQTVTDVRVSNEPKEKTNMGNIRCNSDTCPCIAKKTIQSENARVSNEPKEPMLCVKDSCISTCPHLARDSTKVENSCCRRATSPCSACCTNAENTTLLQACPWLTTDCIKKQPIADPNELVDMINVCLNPTTCPCPVPNESFSGNSTIIDTMTDACVTEAEEEIDCNPTNCPCLTEEPVEQQVVENVTVSNDVTERQEPEEEECSCKIKRCSFADETEPSECNCFEKSSSACTLDGTKELAEAQESDNAADEEQGESEFYSHSNEIESNYKLLGEAQTGSTILNKIEYPRPSRKDMNTDCTYFESDETKEEFECCETDDRQYIADTNPSCNKNNICSKTRCNIPPPHVPYFSDMYELPEEKLWNNHNASIPDEYFSCVSCSSGSSSGSSASSNSSNYCVLTNLKSAGSGCPQYRNENCQLRQEQESCCRCLKCLSATCYQLSMPNCHRPQYCNERPTSFTNSNCQTENNSNKRYKNAESTCSVDKKRCAPKKRADCNAIVSAGHSNNPCFKAEKRRRI